MKKAVKIVLFILLGIFALILTAFATFFALTADAKLQPEKLVDYAKTITVCDENGNKLENTSFITKQKSVNIDKLSQDTINAFIASEDRNFYKHDGLNYKRMVKAAYKNITSRSFKEGASTISQQLIKNTHLSSDKTILRKLKEIKLTKQLERRYDKDRILEMYLNTIYFGHSCYGLQSAANFYFGKNAEELTLNESATLVGLLTSPNNYSPLKNPEKSIKRRNTVLQNMLDCGFIDKTVFEHTVAMPITTAEQADGGIYSDYLKEVFNELEELEIDPYGQFSELKITTFMDADIQNALNGITAESDFSYFIRQNCGGVAAFKSSISLAKRQIGSTAKPIFVYAPAIEEKKVNIFTKILDEPVNFNGYQPENYDKKYHGSVSVEDSIKFSYNVPAVKTFNTLNLNEVEKYAQKMNIDLGDGDLNLSLALGAMKEGISLKQLCDSYSTFANGGNFTKSAFIKSVSCDQGKSLYQAQFSKQKVFSEGTCSLINDVLTKTAQSGTARKLKYLNFDVACKTGTCGNKEGNTDAYTISYTGDYCLGVWLGDKDNKRIQATGGGECCNIAKEVLQKIYANRECTPPDKDSGTKCIEIDKEDYENYDKIIICDINSPKLNRLNVKCLADNIPDEVSVKFTKPSIKKPTIEVNNNKVCISLCQTKYYSYVVNRLNNGKQTTVYDGEFIKNIEDCPPDGDYVYTVTPYYQNGKDKFIGETVTLPRIMISKSQNQEKIPDIARKDWYNQ